MDDKKLTAYFLHFVGKEAYTLIKNLVYPESSIDISYNALKKKVLQNFKPTNFVAAERGNDLRPATGIVLPSNGKRMVTILDLDDLSCHRRHIDQVEFNTKGQSVNGTPAVSNTNESFADDLMASEKNVSEEHTTSEESEVSIPRRSERLRSRPPLDYEHPHAHSRIQVNYWQAIRLVMRLRYRHREVILGSMDSPVSKYLYVSLTYWSETALLPDCFEEALTSHFLEKQFSPYGFLLTAYEGMIPQYSGAFSIITDTPLRPHATGLCRSLNELVFCCPIRLLGKLIVPRSRVVLVAASMRNVCKSIRANLAQSPCSGNATLYVTGSCYGGMLIGRENNVWFPREPNRNALIEYQYRLLKNRLNSRPLEYEPDSSPITWLHGGHPYIKMVCNA
ncbi:hypothetical protein CLF_101801 [Clonorchis sinensis]|uniref:Uncharacterized protein n=1 Tax=Clonorchis sinensis TaxID=79923 RepID=G7Y6L5_CLOSI|nr:hypothetical protein CLF_101801 [Clonorchis sinensis]